MKKIHWKWILGIPALLAVIAVISFVGLHLHVTSTTADQILTAKEAQAFDADCILVLGAGVREDGQPSHMLEDRLLTALEVYEAGASDRFLMSGDHGRAEYDEVNTMKNFVMDHDVPSDKVFMDHAGFSTYDSLYRARDVFQAKKVIIVTQGYHLYRALYTANAMGLEACGVAADLRPYAGMPYFELREKAARVSYIFQCLFMPEPKYLGEVIPISGDGNLTNG